MIANGYITLNQLKLALRIPFGDVLDDSLLNMAAESASRLVDAYCGRNFLPVASGVRYFHTHDPYLVHIDDAQTVTKVETSSSEDGIYDIEWNMTPHTGDVQLEPLNECLGGITWPYTRIRAIGDYVFPVDMETTVKVTADFGWPAVPATVQQATVIQASRIFKRLDSPLGVAGFGDLGVMRVSRGLDPDVAQLIEGYRRVVGVA